MPREALPARHTSLPRSSLLRASLLLCDLCVNPFLAWALLRGSAACGVWWGGPMGWVVRRVPLTTQGAGKPAAGRGYVQSFTYGM